jgi:hypothetical protein
MGDDAFEIMIEMVQWKHQKDVEQHAEQKR